MNEWDETDPEKMNECKPNRVNRGVCPFPIQWDEWGGYSILPLINLI